MNWRAIWAIVRKDLKIVRQSKGVIIPLTVVPLILMVLVPALAASLPWLAQIPGNEQALRMERYIQQMPDNLRVPLLAYNETQRAVVLLVVYYLAPMYLVLPLMVASVVAADSFAGEKERKTLEALLYTPTTDRELFVAKLLAAWIPAVAIAWIGFALYSVVVNWAAWPAMQQIFFPNAMWWVLALWVAPAVAGMGLGFTVMISAQVDTFQEAYQLGGLIVIPIVGLIVGQAAGLLYFSPIPVFILGIAFWAIDAGLIWFGGRSFQRSELAQQI